MLQNNVTVILMLALFVSSISAEEVNTPQFEAFITAEDLGPLFTTEQDRLKALHLFEEINIKKVWIEFLRRGYSPNKDFIIEIRDFFANNQMDVSGALTTTASNEFGVASTETSLFMNYQSDKTRQDVSGRVRKYADVFDEIIIDDFFETDDTSDMSKLAKGQRSWSQYRMDLMCDFSKRFIIEAARSVNSNVRLIIKYPQWYDRFHPYGYDVLRQPAMFDGVWIGTETRSPYTERFGYVLPTQGYINYSWLGSIAKGKTGGAWFDFHDCTAKMYVMQAYQSVLAGAEEIILFGIGDVVKQSDSARALAGRYDAICALGKLLNNQKTLGMVCYKPPHSDGSDAAGGANLFIFDYIASMGLSPIMTSNAPVSRKVIFLSRHAVGDAQIGKYIHRWTKEGVCLVMTPDFLAAVDDADISKLAGYDEKITLHDERKGISKFIIRDDKFQPPSPIQLRPIPVPKGAEILCAGQTSGGVVPILTRRKLNDSTDIFVLNISTFSQKEIVEAGLMLLPTRPLDVALWPERIVNCIRSELPSPYPIKMECPNNVGVYYYQSNILVLASFNETPVQVSVSRTDGQLNTFYLDNNFPHVDTVSANSTKDRFDITLAPWELAVIRWK